MKITKQTLNEIIDKIGNIDAETGGILGSKNNIICSFYFDKNASRYYQEYYPNIDNLNVKLEDWKKDNITFAGIIHSHPNNYSRLSDTD